MRRQHAPNCRTDRLADIVASDMRIAVLMLTVLAAAGIYLLLDPFGAAPSAPGGPGSENARRSEEEPARPGVKRGDARIRERTAQALHTGPNPDRPHDPTEPEPGQEPAAADTDADPDAAVEGPEPNVVIQVRDAVTGQPVAGFRVSPDLRRWIDGEQGRLELHLPANVRHELRIEATDCVPTSKVLTVPVASEMWQEIVYLEPSAPFSGVEITAVDPVGEPVAHLNVAVWRLAHAGAERASRPLWSRRGSSPTGRYRLPDLEPGHYLLEFRALDEGGAPLPLMSDEQRIQLLGGDLVPVRVALRAGVLLRLTAEDPLGQPSGEGVEIRLVDPEGRRLPQVWIASESEQPAAAVDRLSAAGEHVLRNALAPGVYSLEAWTDGERVDTVPLDLWQPGVQRVKVVVHRRD